MKHCSHCGNENGVDARFCAHCGGLLPGDQTPPPPARTGPAPGARIGSLLIGGLCVLYLINPTAGFFELIPDNLPIIGNLDEAGAMTGLLLALNQLGLIKFGLRP